MSDQRLKMILAEVRQAMEALYGERLAGLVLFGSWARRDAAPGSDIDLLVVLKGRCATQRRSPGPERRSP
jgi:predicted nucleotidyltransferase